MLSLRGTGRAVCALAHHVGEFVSPDCFCASFSLPNDDDIFAHRGALPRERKNRKSFRGAPYIKGATKNGSVVKRRQQKRLSGQKAPSEKVIYIYYCSMIFFICILIYLSGVAPNNI